MRKMRQNFTRYMAWMLLFMLVLTGCGRKSPPEVIDSARQSATIELAVEEATEEATEATTEEVTEEATEEVTATADTEKEAPEPEIVDTPVEPELSEDGVYTTRDDVALYIHLYGKLPSNFITKKQARKLGWEGGSLEDYAPGKCIGGDYFGNYEGLLPADKEYRECDIDTLGKSKRGAKRIIYSDDGYIYYTEDHYESFELLYEP